MQECLLDTLKYIMNIPCHMEEVDHVKYCYEVKGGLPNFENGALHIYNLLMVGLFNHVNCMKAVSLPCDLEPTCG